MMEVLVKDLTAFSTNNEIYYIQSTIEVMQMAENTKLVCSQQLMFNTVFLWKLSFPYNIFVIICSKEKTTSTN